MSSGGAPVGCHFGIFLTLQVSDFTEMVGAGFARSSSYVKETGLYLAKGGSDGIISYF